MPNSFIEVYGRLEAIGTPTQPITFISIRANPGDWHGIYVREQGIMHLNHTVVQHGYFNIGIDSQVNASATIIENTVSQFSNDIGMFISDHSWNLVDMHNVAFRDNGKNRIHIYADDPEANITEDVSLTAQPGLDGYEIYIDNTLDDFIVPNGITLTIEPDVAVFMTEGKFEVNGGLEAIGTSTQPITFTSITTDTYPWQGISVDSGDIELKYATIQRSNGNGLSILDGTVTAYCNAITNNLGSGIFVDANAQGDIQLAYNSLVNNTVAGLQNESPVWLDARYTWWGAVDGPSGIGSGSGDAANGNVYITPWLNAAECEDELPLWQVFLPVIINSE